MSTSSSSSSSSSKTSGVKANVFINEKFAGDKPTFQGFADEVRTHVMNEIGEVGVRYLFTDWPIKPGTENEPLLSSEFIPLPVPQLLDGQDEIEGSVLDCHSYSRYSSVCATSSSVVD